MSSMASSVSSSFSNLCDTANSPDSEQHNVLNLPPAGLAPPSANGVYPLGLNFFASTLRQQQREQQQAAQGALATGHLLDALAKLLPQTAAGQQLEQINNGGMGTAEHKQHLFPFTPPLSSPSAVPMRHPPHNQLSLGLGLGLPLCLPSAHSQQQRKRRRMMGNLDNTLDGLVAKRADQTPLKRRYQSETEAIELPDDELEIKRMEADPDVCTRMCSVCGYQGKWVSEMIRHKRVHTNDRPFKCKYCNRTSKWKADLIRHVAKTHGIRVVSKYSRSKAFELGKRGAGDRKEREQEEMEMEEEMEEEGEEDEEEVIVLGDDGREGAEDENNNNNSNNGNGGGARKLVVGESPNSQFRKAQRLDNIVRNRQQQQQKKRQQQLDGPMATMPGLTMMGPEGLAGGGGRTAEAQQNLLPRGHQLPVTPLCLGSAFPALLQAQLATLNSSGGGIPTGGLAASLGIPTSCCSPASVLSTAPSNGSLGQPKPGAELLQGPDGQKADAEEGPEGEEKQQEEEQNQQMKSVLELPLALAPAMPSTTVSSMFNRSPMEALPGGMDRELERAAGRQEQRTAAQLLAAVRHQIGLSSSASIVPAFPALPQLIAPSLPTTMFSSPFAAFHLLAALQQQRGAAAGGITLPLEKLL